jgi:hypothetical protein
MDMKSSRRVFIASAVCGILAAGGLGRTDAVLGGASGRAADATTVHALFALDDPASGPFPSDVFTVPDDTHNTGHRISLPYPDCTVRVSDCDDLAVINTLDGFGLQPQLSIAFDGPIDVATVDSSAVFLINLGSTLDNGPGPGGRIGINQIVWDSLTHTLYVESNELLDQHTRYALIVTNRLRDLEGRPIEPGDTFRRFRQTVRGEYKQDLLAAIQAAHHEGTPESDIVAASVLTTQSITPVMERIRQQIKEGTPEPANFLLGPTGERAVFNRADVTSIAWRQQTGANPIAFTSAPISVQMLQAIPGAVGTIAYGYYVSPDYLVHPGEYMPSVGTRTGTPAVQGSNRIYFTLYLPSGTAPPSGWPVAIAGHSGSGNQHQTAGIVAATNASHGIATIGINTPGSGFGPLSTLTITRANGTSLTIADEGRGIDQDGDGIIAIGEGAAAAAPRTWTLQERDGFRQMAADLMQLVRVFEVGMDVDGDGAADLDPARIYYHGVSASARFGTMFVALEPNVAAAVFTFPGGLTPENDRWSPQRRGVFGAMLQRRIPALINAPGIASIEGIPVAAPHFNENKPRRDEPAVVNTAAGAIEIQKAMELAELGSQSGVTPVVWARHLRQRPLAGVAPKSVLYQSAETDQTAVSPGVAAILRAGALTDVAVHYRHDLAFAEDPTLPKNPHTILIGVTSPAPFFRSIAHGLLNQTGIFFSSGGAIVTHPEPARLFEIPIRTPLPEQLKFIQ